MAVKASSIRGKGIGVFSADKLHGKFCESWQTAMDVYKFETINIAASIDCIMATKEYCELFIIQEACQVSVDIFQNYLNEYILEIIDSGKVS